MSLLMGLFPETDTLATTLAGGRAPLHWQRLLVQKTAALDGLRRSSDWLAPLVRVRPALREGPLLGQRLAALTGASPDAAAGPVDGHSSRRPAVPAVLRHDGQDGSAAEAVRQATGRPRARALSKLASSSERKTPLALPPPYPVDEALLRRVAGALPAMALMSPHRPPMEALESLRNGAQPVVTKPASRGRWLHRLAQRAGRALTLSATLANEHLAKAETDRAYAAAFERAGSQPLRTQREGTGATTRLAQTNGVQPAGPPGDTPWQRGGAALARISPALQPVRKVHRFTSGDRGGAAPASLSAPEVAQISAQSPETRHTLSSLLARLAGQEKVEPATNERRTQPPAAKPGVTSDAHAADSLLSPPAQDVHRAPTGRQVLGEPIRTAPVQQEYDGPASALAGWNPAVRTGTVQPDNAEEQPPLPTMSPLRRTFLSPGRAANAGVHLEPYSVEWAENHETMDALAAMLKRILDEEARRHGIDV
ncbi:MAG: hypothetical protein DCC55_03200 [Chloroflexi bacterium]|nr:MAG: hypothetical protein DCC55_03200 [Chloroflexota bacterium]